MSLMSFFRRPKKELELDDEIEAHLAPEVQQRIDRGESRADARSNAVREFGNIALIKEVTRETWRARALDRIVQDGRHVLRYTWSQFRKDPGLLLITVVTLALVMGANAMMFSAINALMLKNRPGAGHPENL